MLKIKKEHLKYYSTSEFTTMTISDGERMLGKIALAETELANFRRKIKEKYPTAKAIVMLADDLKEEELYVN